MPVKCQLLYCETKTPVSLVKSWVSSDTLSKNDDYLRFDVSLLFFEWYCRGIFQIILSSVRFPRGQQSRKFGSRHSENHFAKLFINWQDTSTSFNFLSRIIVAIAHTTIQLVLVLNVNSVWTELNLFPFLFYFTRKNRKKNWEILKQRGKKKSRTKIQLRPDLLFHPKSTCMTMLWTIATILHD